MSVEVYGDQDFPLEDECLVATRIAPPEVDVKSAEPHSVSPVSGTVDPSLSVLFPAATGLQQLQINRVRERREAATGAVRDELAVKPGEDLPPARKGTASPEAMSVQPSGEETAVDLAVTRADGKPSTSSEAARPALEGRVQSTDLASRTKVSRIDSAQSDGSRSPSSAKPFSAPPLKLETNRSHDEHEQNGRHERLHSQSAGAPRDGPPQQESTSPAPKSATTLPSFQTTFGEVPVPVPVGLVKLAEAAGRQVTQQQQQQYVRHHSQSFGSATSPMSPVISHHPQYPQAVQGSPHAYYPPPSSVRSPTNTVSTMGESPHHYGSPQQASPYSHIPHYAAFPNRRPSSVQDGSPAVPGMPSASSSGESHNGYAGSSTDGYSTANTTPIDQAQVPDGTPRPSVVGPMLPLPPGMPPPPPHALYGPFSCDEPGCTAPPFQTQYLLTSHRHVHNPSRPHYCPVADCVRGTGGRGFKRKNEMIRHRLVHESPGYVCPFCTDREHKYPRPDNLQRHVKVHHSEKRPDDPSLREVLEKRTDGNGKARRRRTGTAGDG